MKNRIVLAAMALGLAGVWAQACYAQSQGLSPTLVPTTDLTNTPAALGYRPMTQLEPAAIKADPFTITPWVGLVVGHDDNVGLSATNKTSSTFTGLSPNLEIGTRTSPNDVYTAKYRGNYGRYSSSTKDNYDDHIAGLLAANQWSTRLRSTLQYDYLYLHDPRGSTTAAANAPDRWDVNGVRGSIAYGAQGAEGQIEADAGWRAKRYITNRDINSVKDYDQADLAGAFVYRVGAATHAVAQVRASKFDYRDTAAGLNSTEMRYFVGMKWEATAQTQGMVKVGYMTKNYSNAALKDLSSPAYEVGMTWRPVTYSAVNLTAFRSFNEATSGGTAILTDSVTALWNHDWTSRVRSTLSAGAGHDVYEGLGRTDDRRNYGVKLSYGIQRWLRFGGELRHDTRSSNGPTNDYTKNLMLFTLEGSL